MKRTVLGRTAVMLLLLALLLALPTMTGCKDKDEDENTETPVATGEADTGDTPGAAEADDEVDTPAVVAPDAQDGSGPAASANAPTTMTVRLAWVEAGENALGVERTVPYTQAAATAAMNALLSGPTADEQATWPAIGTAIPAGTRLLGLSVSNGVAKVDLSEEFGSGGGTFSVTSRLAQVVYTLTQFPTIQSVEFYVDGVRVEMFSSEGLILDGPQTIQDYENLLPMDA